MDNFQQLHSQQIFDQLQDDLSPVADPVVKFPLNETLMHSHPKSGFQAAGITNVLDITLDGYVSYAYTYVEGLFKAKHLKETVVML